MRNILVMDVTKIDAGEVEYFTKLFNYLNSENFDNIVYTRQAGRHKGMLNLRKLPKGAVLVKNEHAIANTCIDFFKENNICSLELCGANDRGSLAYMASMLKKLNIDVRLVPDLIISRNDMNMQNYRCCGFFIGDILATNCSNFSQWTVLSFAILEWLGKIYRTDFDLQSTLLHYHKLYEQYGTCEDSSLNRWLENGCRGYHHSEGYGGVVLSLIIGLWGKDIDEIEELVNHCLTVTFNSDVSKLASMVICTALWLIRAKFHKKRLIQILNKKYPTVNLSSDLNSCKRDFTLVPNTINFIRLALCAFVTSADFNSTLNSLQDITVGKNALFSVAGALAEAYYRRIPQDILNLGMSLIPQKFINLISNFNSHCSLY